MGSDGVLMGLMGADGGGQVQIGANLDGFSPILTN